MWSTVLGIGARGTVLALTFLVIVALPSAAVAKSRSDLFPNVIQFSVPASNGYKITVSATIHGPGRVRAVKLEAVHESPLAEQSSRVEYTTPGKLTPKRLQASFGGLGAISVHFRPSGKVEQIKLPKRCGGPLEAKLGSFAGTIRFNGERGYTKVNARRARGGVGDPLAIIGPHHGRTIGFCATPNSSAPEESQEPFLNVENKGQTVGFLAISVPSPSPQESPVELFDANTFEKRRRISINRSISTSGPASDFSFNSTLNTATVAPPAPFVGSAAFQRHADGSTTWTGSLSVPLPGRAMVRLAGHSFTGSLGGS